MWKILKEHNNNNNNNNAQYEQKIRNTDIDIIKQI